MRKDNGYVYTVRSGWTKVQKLTLMSIYSEYPGSVKTVLYGGM